MYLPTLNPLKEGDNYFFIKIIKSGLKETPQEFVLQTFVVKTVTPTVVYGATEGSDLSRIHSLREIYRTKEKALSRLRELYIEKYTHIQEELDAIKVKIDVIEEEIPYVPKFGGLDCAREDCRS